MTDPRYPIGKYEPKPALTEVESAAMIQELANGPALFAKAYEGLSETQLETPYRENVDGKAAWTLRQLAHHVADSHLNAYIRFKWALTEDHPTIKPYHEKKWANLPDSKLPIGVSLRMLADLHERWVALLHTLTPEQWSRMYLHPESQKSFDLKFMLGMYHWHMHHHTAHVTELRKVKGW